VSIATRQNPDLLPTERQLRLICSEEWGGNRPIDTSVALPGIRGRLYSRPCDGSQGGDVHYLAVCGAGLLSRLWISDVAGHGQTVSRVSELVHEQLWRNMNHHDQRRVLSALNARLEREGISAMTTVATATYYAVGKQLSISYAGHPPAWYFHIDTGQWERLTVPVPRQPNVLTNGPLAVDPAATFTKLDRQVEVGDRLVLMTDGVLEARCHTGEQFGDERAQQILSEHPDADVRELVDHLLGAIGSWSDGAVFNQDDVTVLAVEFVPGSKSPRLWQMIRNMLVRPRGNSTEPPFADQHPVR
jgi:sigma-B regulation protein RsbU (phosphoserine phosphatase)